MNKRSVTIIHVRIFRETRFQDIELLFPLAFDLDRQQMESGEIRIYSVNSTERALGVSLASKCY